MKAFILSIVLIFSAYSAIVLQSSPSTTTVVSPPSTFTVASTLGSGWITSSSFSSQTVYQSLFYSRCNGVGIITISAVQSFSLYFDGNLLGSSSENKYQVKLPCGNHNLTIVVLSKLKYSGLTFTINQDQSNCFNCNINGFWNQKTCSCQCINSRQDCPCKQPKVWKDYPLCGCRCRRSFQYQSAGAVDLKASSESVASEDENNADNGDGGEQSDDDASAAAGGSAKLSILPFPWKCLKPRYYDQLTCQCVCHYKYCKPPSFFDPVACRCKRFIIFN